MASNDAKKTNVGAKSGGKKKEVKKETGLGLFYKKGENFGEWYSEVVVSGEMIEYYDISGCYILRPWTMSIWETMQMYKNDQNKSSGARDGTLMPDVVYIAEETESFDWIETLVHVKRSKFLSLLYSWAIDKAFFDGEIKKMKIKNCYFPLFVSPGVLQREKDHIEGFAPEVAWVTKSGESELEVPIAIRPTSETVMYPYYSKWIRGHRDLPLKLNQWCNVVRWEFSHPTPFIRSREFLWQEGHTAFATKAEADAEVLEILELYRRIYEEYLAIPVVKGKKSELEKFAGGLYTTSVEAFIPNTGRGKGTGVMVYGGGRVLGGVPGWRGGFAPGSGAGLGICTREWGWVGALRRGKGVTVEEGAGLRGGGGEWWGWGGGGAGGGCRSGSVDGGQVEIGVMVMVHGDDKGLVLPPKVASIQVIVIPVPYKDVDTQKIIEFCKTTVATLSEAGLCVEADFRDNYSPGWKYSHWEMKGVPLRIEIGPKDLANNQVRAVRRDNSAKVDVPVNDELAERVNGMLADIQQSLFDAAKQKRDACIKVVKTWDEFVEALNQKKMILAPWCNEEEVEKDVKARTKGEMGAAKTLCSPFDQPELHPEDGFRCVFRRVYDLMDDSVGRDMWKELVATALRSTNISKNVVCPCRMWDEEYIGLFALPLVSLQRSGPTGAGVTNQMLM
ncbi:hypothetical protein TEA_011811 [Camellia sinensis var. sinensis]|uniref:proline--tRNA ligase n=1 Tax=Camellia sinensis var. sinensis TaxID=542762 RepID=A0A4S4DU58_CAMSN|nr:hypothetical protein TEA_011811 [Camellia sinensis var. sinensis]